MKLCWGRTMRRRKTTRTIRREAHLDSEWKSDNHSTNDSSAIQLCLIIALKKKAYSFSARLACVTSFISKSA
jgi:hypothetical protein